MTLLALVNVAVGACGLAVATFLALREIADTEGWERRLLFVLAGTAIFGPLGLLPLASGIGLWRLRSWARHLQLLLVGFGLLYSAPFLFFSDPEVTRVVGVLAASLIATLVYLSLPTVKGLFSGQPRRGLVVAAVVVLLAHALGVVVISTWPHHSVSPQESGTIGDIRTVISAQAAYAQANGGYYDRLDCLGEPVRCLPGYKGSHFLDSVLASGAPKSGYQRTFHPGPLAPPDAVAAARISASSLKAYAYVAVPVQIGRTGVRGFCGDSTGSLCFTTDGTPPAVKDGLCVHREPVEGSSPAPSECQTLQ